MPLLRFDLIEGRTDRELALLLDTAHRAMVEAFGVPGSDRYQIVHEHPRRQIRAEDTGLGLRRSDRLVMLQVTSRPRSLDQKQRFYRLLAARLAEACDLDPQDLIVSMTLNTDADWSFGLGEAQFVTGRLG